MARDFITKKTLRKNKDGKLVKSLTDRIIDNLNNLPTIGSGVVLSDEVCRPDKLSMKWYGDIRYDWVIMKYNKIKNPFSIHEGLKYNIPELDQVLERTGNFAMTEPRVLDIDAERKKLNKAFNIDENKILYNKKKNPTDKITPGTGVILQGNNLVFTDNDKFRRSTDTISSIDTVDPVTGQVIDPITGRIITTPTGVVDSEGRIIDPTTGQLIDPTTGIPIQPGVPADLSQLSPEERERFADASGVIRDSALQPLGPGVGPCNARLSDVLIYKLLTQNALPTETAAVPQIAPQTITLDTAAIQERVQVIQREQQIAQRQQELRDNNPNIFTRKNNITPEQSEIIKSVASKPAPDVRNTTPNRE